MIRVKLKHKIINLIIILVVINLLGGCHINTDIGQAKTFYVDSILGDDENDGALDAPFQTLNAVNTSILVPGDKVLFHRGQVFRGQLYPQSGSEAADITYGAYDEGSKPILMGSINTSDSEGWELIGDNLYRYINDIPVDVGNIIINRGEQFGVKQWYLEELVNPLDYYYDTKDGKLYLYATENPGQLYEDMECALNLDIIDETGISYVTYQDLALKYGGAHGIGGGNTSHITIKDLEITYIGGSFLYNQNDVNVRYGNAIEFWANASHNLVENCLIYEIFDSGVTNQNNGKKAIQKSITYQNNTIYNCGMASFEIDNEPKSGLIEDVYFINNTCKDVGLGWSSTQDRYFIPEENLGLGHHVTSFYITTPVNNLVIKNNTFEGAYNNSEVSSIFLLTGINPNSKTGIVIGDNKVTGPYNHYGIIIKDDLRLDLNDETSIKNWLKE